MLENITQADFTGTRLFTGDAYIIIIAWWTRTAVCIGRVKNCGFLFVFLNCINCLHTLTKCSGNAEQIGVLAVQTFLTATLEAEIEKRNTG